MYSHLTSLSLLLLSFIQHAFLIDAFTIEERANGGVSCCRQLSKNYDTLVSYVGSTLYHDQQMGVPNGYWSQQAAELSPVCRFTPRTATDVSGAVRILTDKQCKFAIRGGGHMSWAEAANIQNGVTIDLSGMKLVSVSQDRTTTSVQGGARWVDVYMKLDAMELAVSGGRVYDVGVGGLTLGGGNSFFGPRSGFGCDNVRSFEVVLANGTIVNANLQQNPDLFKALKGGSNNFGIVTKFDLITFEQGQMWGGFVIYPPQTVEQQVQALQGFTQASGDGVDPYAAVINSYIFKADGLAFIANYYTYTKPQANPAILTNFTAIQPQTQSGLRTTNLTTMTIELAAGTPNGYRQLFGTATFKNDASLLSKILALANETYAPVRHLRDFQASVTLQPISRAQTSKGEGMGGNSLGLDASRGDLVWLDLTIQYSLPSDDTAISTATQSLLRQCIAYARARNLHDRYLYLNYALKEQDPLRSYGQDNYENLRRVADKYDPERVWQRLVPGGFKLWRGRKREEDGFGRGHGHGHRGGGHGQGGETCCD